MKLTDADRSQAERLAAEAGLPPVVTDPSALAALSALQRARPSSAA